MVHVNIPHPYGGVAATKDPSKNTIQQARAWKEDGENVDEFNVHSHEVDTGMECRK